MRMKMLVSTAYRAIVPLSPADIESASGTLIKAKQVRAEHTPDFQGQASGEMRKETVIVPASLQPDG